MAGFAGDTTRPSLPSGGQSWSTLVMAGGRSRRFGSDKLEAVVDGSTILDRVIAAVRGSTDDITIVGRAYPGMPTVLDPEPRRGPLAALAFALPRVAAGDAVLVVGGDHPFLVPGLLKLLVDSLDRHDAVVPVDRDGRAQPLVAVYRPSLAAAMDEAVNSGRLSLIDFLGSVDVDWVGVSRWEVPDPDGSSFLDVDTTDDLFAVMDR